MATYRVITVEGIEEASRMAADMAVKLEDMRHAQPIINQMLSMGYIRRWQQWSGYLYDTGRLMRSFTDPSLRSSGDALRRAHFDTIEYGSSVPYARFYESQLLRIDNAFLEGMASALADYYEGSRVVRGHMRGGTWVRPYIRGGVASPLAEAHG